MPKMDVTRNIKTPIQNMLWGMAAGRCQFDGCNKPLWESSITKEQVNIAQKAHIWAFSPDGPRGNNDVGVENINRLKNLMLVCHECHRLIDQDDAGDKYSVELLQAMKKVHEDRIDLAASISANKRSHVLLYGSNIGEHNSPVNFQVAAEAIFPDYYPADRTPFELGVSRSPHKDSEDGYWIIERANLEAQFTKAIKPRLVNGEIKHLSVFGVAPQPLLILLGTLLSDMPSTDVFQLHREPQSWKWQNDIPVTPYQVIEPNVIKQTVALNLSLSATIDNDRISNVLGNDLSIWTITVPLPHNDSMRSKSQLRAFRQVFRLLMDRIKAVHGHDNVIHIFPATPVSVAIEIGRIWMPKADLSLLLYDEIKAKGGFVKAFAL